MIKKWLEYRTTAILFVMIGAVSYGLLSTLIKWVYRDFSMVQVTSAQVLIGTIFLWLIVLVRPKSWVNPFRGPWLQLVAIGVFGLFGTTLLFNATLNYLDASLSMILLFQFTWITVLIDSLVNKKFPKLMQILGVVIILTGTLLAVNIFKVNTHQISTLGVVLGLASAVSYSSFIFFTGQIKSSTSMDSVFRSALMWTGAIPLILFMWPPTYVTNIDVSMLLIYGLILGLLGQVIPTITFNFGIPRIGSTLSALIGSIELPAALIFAHFILSEKITIWQWIGILFIIAGIFISEYKRK